MEELEGETRRKLKSSSKFVKIPLIIHMVMKRESAFALQIEHLQVKRTTICIPRNSFSLEAEEIGDYIKEIYPTAKSFVIQYEKRGEETVPFCAQLFMTRKIDEVL
ncbi:MAG: hypothetical protein QXJ75_00760 [Candidatus Bathyarchaeia archaeon]